MRTLMVVILAGLCLGVAAGESRAQFLPPGAYGGSFAVNPFVFPPAYSASAGFVSPYGYRSFGNFTAYPTPWGYNSFYNFNTTVRPYSTGPFHSVYYNPFTASYQYGPGAVNSPTFFYSFGTPFWP